MQVGEYEIGEKLGEGGMGEVYAATHVRLGSRHALKLFAHPKEDAADVRARFEQEGRLLARLRHPRVVRVTDFGSDAEGRPYFVMDLVTAPEGAVRSLADAAAHGVDEETVARWYDDVREGLAYIHGQGIVHRDLKLENVLIGPDGHAVLADFGISRVEDGASAAVDPVRTLVRVQDGQAPLMGSVGYLAPELALGARATAQSDWYALGVIVYRLLTGTWCDARTDVVGGLSTYDPVWARILPKLLHANPAGRACPSFAAEKAKDREEEAFLAERREDARRRRMRRGRFAGWAVCAALALLAAGCAVYAALLRAELSRVRTRLRQARPSLDQVFSRPDGMSASDFYSTVSGLLYDDDVFKAFYDFSADGGRVRALVDELKAKAEDEPEDSDARRVLEVAVRNLGGDSP